MKPLYKRCAGLVLLIGLLLGRAYAEPPPCNAKDQIALGYTLEQRWEVSVDCAKNRKRSTGLLDIARDFAEGTNGAPKDWRRAVEAFELHIETSKASQIQTYGARLRETSFQLLIRNFSKGNPDNGWPKDLNRARSYAEQDLKINEQPSAPEYADQRAAAIEYARKRLAEIDFAILNEARRSLKAGDMFRDKFASGAGLGPEMIAIPPGSFTKGFGKIEDFSIFAPAHRVDIRYRFAVGRYEVTQAEWAPCVADGKCSRVIGNLEEYPVEGLSWDDAQVYVAWLNDKMGLTGRADRYRLMTESEWEYVARAGTTTRFFFGDNPDHLEDYAWTYFSREDDENMVPWAVGPEPVGTKRPNQFGLYDIYGNVAEWVEDCSNDRYFGNNPRDGSAFKGNGSCRMRVLRGGSYEDGNMTSYTRKFMNPRRDDGPYGLRLARTIPD